MKKLIHTGIICALLCGTVLGSAQTPPPPAKPDKEHAFLKRFVGEWTADALKMTESVKLLGEIWVVSTVYFSQAEKSPRAMFTLGYDSQKKRYVGTWVDSMTKYLWVYEGTVDSSGNKLTLNTVGPDMSSPGKMAKFKDIYEFKGKDEKVLKSMMQQPDGKWITFMNMTYKRKQ